MSMSLWNECNGINFVKPLQVTAWRVIESQEFVATRKLVDSLEEQIILEDLIEENKPAISSSALSFHPLLYTPFRYPPLKHGSRFGARIFPSLWYGSVKVKTALAEKAYYQLHFIRASAAKLDLVQLPLTVFSASVAARQGVHLDRAPFKSYVDVISSPTSYQVSQHLGAAMRTSGVQAFTYYSARSQEKEVNVALFTPSAFQFKNPNEASFQTWQCTVHHGVVEFTQENVLQRQVVQFSESLFLVNGDLPVPAV